MSLILTSDGEVVNADGADIRDYKSCSEKLTLECYGLAHKKYFYKGVCKNCANYKQLMMRREKEGKLSLMNSSLDQYQIYKLFKSLNSSQLLKLAGILTLEQHQELVLETQQCNTPNNEEKNSCDNKQNNELKNERKDELNKEQHNISNNDQKYPTSIDNSPKLESYRKPTLKLVTSH